MCLVMAGCQNKPVPAPELIPTPTTTTTTPADASKTLEVVQGSNRIALSWESRPERKSWSDAIVEQITLNLDAFLMAQDVKEICPAIGKMSKEKQIKVLGEFFVAVAYYESGYNPLSSSVDVGQKGNLATYSVGLYQVSEIDAKYQNMKLRYTYKQLQDPINNIKFAFEIMNRQLSKRSKIMLDNTDKMKYWAVILKGNKYSKIPQIIAKARANGGC